jgi:probable HAF family extracellular repeat protein
MGDRLNNRRLVILLSGLSLVAATALGIMASSPPPISIYDLGVLTGMNGGGSAINDRGQVLLLNGESILWQDGSLTDLGMWNGRPFTATSLNNRGQIVGSGLVSEEPFMSRALLWQDGRFRDLGLPSGASFAGAFDLNEKGLVVGSVDRRAVLWEDGRVVDLGIEGLTTIAYGVNSHGDVVGVSLSESGAWNAFLWQDGAPSLLEGLSDVTTEAYAINDRSVIVGVSAANAVLWKDGAIVRLGSFSRGLSSWARDINARGQVAGTCEVSDEVDTPPDEEPPTTLHACLWQDGSIFDLGTLPGHDCSAAFAINDSGEVVGASWDTCDGARTGNAVRWTTRLSGGP